MSKKPKKIEDSEEYFKRLDQYWRATNYLAAAQLYMKENPLLRKPLKREQVKTKIVGHWGTVPGQNFVYAHLNRAITNLRSVMIQDQPANPWWL